MNVGQKEEVMKERKSNELREVERWRGWEDLRGQCWRSQAAGFDQSHTLTGIEATQFYYTNHYTAI